MRYVSSRSWRFACCTTIPVLQVESKAASTNLEVDVVQQVPGPVAAVYLVLLVVPCQFQLLELTLADAVHPYGTSDTSAVAGTTNASSWSGRCDYMAVSCILHQPFPPGK